MTETNTGTDRSAGVRYQQMLDKDSHPVRDIRRVESPMKSGPSMGAKRLHSGLSLITRHSLVLALCIAIAGAASSAPATDEITRLPEPEVVGTMPVEKALSGRRSTRRFDPSPLDLSVVAQLLWSAQGITNDRGFRTAPSAGGLFPLEIYLVTGQVSGLESGAYAYDPVKHHLMRVSSGDIRADLAEAALGQQWIAAAPAVLIIAARFDRTTRKYGSRGARYVYIEAGHASQNVYLQSESHNLGTCVVGAFDDVSLRALLGFPQDIDPIAIMPVGKRLRDPTD